jgi:hypothetical protein
MRPEPLAMFCKVRSVDLGALVFSAEDKSRPIAERPVAREYIVAEVATLSAQPPRARRRAHPEAPLPRPRRAQVHEMQLSGGLVVEYTGAQIQLPAALPPSARRTGRMGIAGCPSGYSFRIARLGDPMAAACACPASCGDNATCAGVSASGLWTTVLVPDSVCDPAPPGGLGATAIIVICAVVAVVVLIALAAVRLCSTAVSVRFPCALAAAHLFCRRSAYTRP